MGRRAIIIGPMRILVACTALVTLAACTNWHAVEVTPAEYLRDNTPDVVRLTRSDSSHIRLRAPMLRGDTIVGLTGQGSPRGTARQVMVPLSSVHGMAVPRFSAAKSAGVAFLFSFSPAPPALRWGGGLFLGFLRAWCSPPPPQPSL